jgi:hypothetical protein
MTTKKKKKTTKKPKIYQSQAQKQGVNIKIDNSKKTSGRARRATTSTSPSVIYLESTQAPQPFPYFFPLQEKPLLPEVASNVSNTLLGNKLGESPKSVFETLAQNTQLPLPQEQKKRVRKTPGSVPVSDATTEKIPEKIDPKQKTMTDFYKLNHKRKPEISESTSSSSAPIPPLPKKARAPRVSKAVPKDQPKMTQVLPPLAKPVPTTQIGEPVGKDSEHYWG